MDALKSVIIPLLVNHRRFLQLKNNITNVATLSDYHESIFIISSFRPHYLPCRKELEVAMKYFQHLIQDFKNIECSYDDILGLFIEDITP